MFRLAQVTDPHFRSFAGARLGDFLGKRAVGALNLVVNRSRKHKMELLEALAEDLRRERPDHVALTGDLSNVSLQAEWREARSWIEGLGRTPDAVTVIPGNHDAYVTEVVRARAFEAFFAAYQTGDVGARPPPSPPASPGANTGQEIADARDTYPFVRLRGPLALIAVNSCVATGDLGAWGEVGSAQLARLEAILAAPETAGRRRVVLIHHPPIRHKGVEDRNLRDRQALIDVLARAGAELVLHGHDHRDEAARLTGPAGTPIPVVGAGSASYAGRPERRARYNIYEIDGDGVTLVTRAHDESKDAFVETHRERLSS